MRVKWAAVVMGACLAAAPVATADEIRVQSTTDTVDAGLVEGLLRDAYLQAQPGDTLKYTGVGTGKALDNAREGLADVVITHAPSLEKKFVEDGYSIGLGRQIFYSDYVIVGPNGKDGRPADPAGVIAKGHVNDAVRAYEDIATQAEATPDLVRFNTRGDNSGTNVQEQVIWGLTDTIPKQAAVNAGGDATRFEPGTGGELPAWYKKQSQGQAANVERTEACVVAGNGCYTMVDRGTFNRLVNNGTVTNLKIVAEKNTATAEGGENLLINPFAVYRVNPDKITTSPAPNVEAGKRFVDFLTSRSFQEALLGFPNAVDPAFRPDAFADVKLESSPPASLAEGAALTVVGTATNRLPGGGPIGGMPVQLQKSTDGGSTWVDTGAAAPTGADGRFSVTATATESAAYRLSLPEHPATTYNAFTASTVDVGPVTVVGTPPPPPTTTDRTSPIITALKLTKRRVSMRVSEPVRIRVVIFRKEKRVARVRIRAKKAGVVSGKHKRLRKGRYRLNVTATDAAGNEADISRVVRRRK